MSLRSEAQGSETQYPHPDVVLPSGALALEAQAGLGLVGGIQTNQVEDDFLQEGEVLWGVVLAYGAGILAKADIENPVKAVLDAPVGSHRGGELFGRQFTRADVVAPLELRLVVSDLTQGVDPSDLLAFGPIGQINDPFRGQHRSDLSDDPAKGRVDLANE